MSAPDITSMTRGELASNGKGLAGPLHTETLDLQRGWVLSVRRKTSGEVLLKW